MKVFLTGSSGRLGSLLLDRLVRLPEVEGITAIDLIPPPGPLPPRVHFATMDVRSPDLPRIMAGHDVVIHTAFIVLWSYRMPEAVRDDVNVNGTRNLARAALGCGARRLIHLSSVAAYDADYVVGRELVTEDVALNLGASGFYYSDNKAQAERVLADVLGGSSVVLTVLRPCLIVGLDGAPDPKAKPFLIDRRDRRVQLVHGDDVASAIVFAATRDLPGAYNVVSDDGYPLSAVLERTGRPPAKSLPRWAVRLGLALTWRFFANPLHPAWLDAAHRHFDCTMSNAKLRALGWTPAHSTESLYRLEG